MAYPATLDALPTTSKNEDLSKNTHPKLHNDVNDAINRLEEVLGLEPQGGSGTVGERIAAVEQSITAIDLVPENYGAKGDGVTDDTEAFEKCSKAIKAAHSGKGGTMFLRAVTYILDNFIWENKITIEGSGQQATTLKAKAGSTNPVIRIGAGKVEGGWRNLQVASNGNAGQHGFQLHAVENETGGGVWNSDFTNVQVGSFSGCQMWFQGGAIGAGEPHQNVTFHNVYLRRPDTGTGATTSRGFKATGQCAKFYFDTDCVIQGITNLGEGKAVGTNIELSREFLQTTTLSAEAAAGQKKVKLTSVAGLEANKLVSIGEGAFNELCEIESIAGSEVTMKANLEFTHANGDTFYALSGTVGAPATKAPVFFLFDGATIQNADLEALVDSAQWVIFKACDAENQARVMKVRHEGFQVHFQGNVSGATEGTALGSGTLTPGSKIITGANAGWVNGDKINGRGIPAGTTVESGGGGAEIHITNNVEETTGGETAMTGVPLVKGGEGKGYIADYGAGCQGSVSYFPNGGIDNAVICHGEHGVRVKELARKSATTFQNTTGITRSMGTAEVLNLGGALAASLTNATNSIKFISGTHATGERIRITATVAATKFITGGNITLPGGVNLTLAAGETVNLEKTDAGPTTWIVIGVQRTSTAVPTAPTIVTATNAALAVPAGAGHALVTVVGGGAGGGGGGADAKESPVNTQVGGGGGGSGQSVTKLISLAEAATLNVTIGAAGIGGAGGAASSNNEGHAGEEGKAANTDTTVAGTGFTTVTARGGSGGKAGAAKSAATVNAGVYGGRATGGQTSTNWMAGGGGAAASASGGGGGSAIGASGRGGGAGGPANGANGGSAGAEGTISSKTGTTEGGTPGNAPENSGQGGDGGGGGAPQGKGGSGGNGGSGVVIISWLP
jgi:hypothetical protein